MRKKTEGAKIEFVTSQYGLHQIIKDAKCLLENSLSCIELIFTLQFNLIADSAVYSSLHSNCHHQIVYAKFNFKICFPLSYKQED